MPINRYPLEEGEDEDCSNHAEDGDGNSHIADDL